MVHEISLKGLSFKAVSFTIYSKGVKVNNFKLMKVFLLSITLVLISSSLKVIFFFEKSELLRSKPFFKNFPMER
jgi:hypothetical protein